MRREHASGLYTWAWRVSSRVIWARPVGQDTAQLHCAEGADVKAHLTKLQTIREDLIAMGADPGDKEFVAIVLGSLPVSWETYLSALTGAATLLSKDLEPDMVLQGISDEAERKAARPGVGGDTVIDAVFYGNSGSRHSLSMP